MGLRRIRTRGAVGGAVALAAVAATALVAVTLTAGTASAGTGTGYLHTSGNKIVETDAEGKEIASLEFQIPIIATRLANGNTLVTSFNQFRAVELDPKGREVWEYKTDTRVTRALRR